MENENNQIYHGILFSFLYLKIYDISSDLLITLVRYMQWNTQIIPVILLTIIALFGTLFYRMKKFQKIRIWFVLLIVAIAITIKILHWPFGHDSLNEKISYNEDQKFTLMDVRLYANTLHTIVLLTIACIKYRPSKT